MGAYDDIWCVLDTPLVASASNSSLLRLVSALMTHVITSVPFPGKSGHQDKPVKNTDIKIDKVDVAWTRITMV